MVAINDPAGNEVERDELSALSWVHEELRRSLEIANKALRRYLKEQEQLSELDTVDPAVLRQARSQYHQSVGVLELVGLGAAAELLRAAESALLRISARPRLITAAAVDTLERGSFALLDFIDRRLAGKSVSTLALFPQYRALQDLASASRIHPADLWTVPWSWRDLTLDTSVPAQQPDADTVNRIESNLLALMRTAPRRSAARMSELFAGLATTAQAAVETAGAPHSRLATLWQLAAGFFEAQADGLLRLDAYSKRAGSGLLAQLRAGEQAEPTQRLAHDLLFFCSQAAPREGKPAGVRLAAVRRGYELTGESPVDYENAKLGRFDPAWVAQARKRVVAAKEVWSAVAGSDLARLPGLTEQFALVGDSLARLYPDGAVLGRALQVAAAHTVAGNSAPPAELAMEVATALLYLEASLDDGEFDHPEGPLRIHRLAQRIDQVRQARDPGTLELWMEELYRRVSDRQTMGSVVQELRASLSEVEKNIDQYFRNPAQREVLIPVPAQLSAMRGVLSVLGLDQASQAVLRMRDDVDALASTEVDPQHAIEVGTFDRLADNLGALSFLIDMVSVQPQMAKRLFRFDPDSGSLTAVMAREDRRTGFDEFDTRPVETDRNKAAALAAPHSQSPSTIDEPNSPWYDPTLRLSLATGNTTLRMPHADADVTQRLARVDPEVTQRLLAHHAAPAVAAPYSLAHDRSGAAAPPDSTVAGASGLEDDPEMREVFLEEAAEVLQGARTALAELQLRHDDMAAMTTVRRAFHTLKGSSRMVGLGAFGQAAWACEQLYNDRLAESGGADHDLRDFSLEACDYFERWVRALAAGDGGGFHPEALSRAADALRVEHRRLPLADDALATEPALPAGPTEAPTETPSHALRERVPDLPLASDLDLTSASADAQLAAPAPAADVLADLELPALDLSALDEAPPEPALSSAPAIGQPSIEVAEAAELDATFDFAAEFDAPAAAPPEAGEAGEAVPFDLSLDLSDLALPESAPSPQADAAPELAFDGLVPADLSAPAALPERTQVLDGALPGPAPVVPVAEAAQARLAEPATEAETEARAEVEADAEAYRQIGPLRIGIALFNIYLNEADELSRRLSVELAEWSLEQHRPVGDSAVALAHSLAGSSGTVGYTDLSQLARLLEHALERCQARGHGRADEPSLFNRAADEIRRLLHLFAAGFLNPPEAELLRELYELAHALPEPALDEGHDEPALDWEQAATAAETADDASTEASPSSEGLEAAASLGRVALLPFTALADAPARAMRPEDTNLGGSLDEDIDQVDAIDAELFPIFIEEAQELLPQLQARLRDWSQHPGDPAAASSCMRCLHTLKGSARLAGAMRLGEMAHRLESAVEYLAADAAAVRGADVDGLMAHVDALEARFDALRSPTPEAAPKASAARPGPARAGLPSVDVAPLPAPIAVPAVASLAVAARAHDEASAPATTPLPRVAAVATAIDWQRFSGGAAQAAETLPAQHAGVATGSVRVRVPLLDRLVNHAGEVSIARARIESDVDQFKGGLRDLTDNLERLRAQLRDIELQAETQIGTRMEAARAAQQFDPLEMDRFTRFQELTRMMAESVADVATVQRGLQRTLQGTEDALAHQARMTRDLQDDLLRTRMVEFEGLSERLYRVVRQAAKETAKPVRLDIVGGGIEIDRGVLDRMTPAFEHLLRNSVVHGIESPEARKAAGKDATGTITMVVTQIGNEVAVEVRDNGAGLDLDRIRDRARAMGLVAADAQPTEAELANLIFQPGFTTASAVTDLAGRGVGMDVVRTDVNAMGGRIDTASAPGQGTSFKLVLPLTTAVTQVVMLRCGDHAVAVPAALVETVRRVSLAELHQAYEQSVYGDDPPLPFFWLDALLAGTPSGTASGRSARVVVIRSAAQRVVLHVDEIVGNQEVVVKNLGPQLSRVPGLVGMTLLPSGQPALIYNPVALATLYGEAARGATLQALHQAAKARQSGATGVHAEAAPKAPLVLVVDDSLTVRRITQRLLEREGYRVVVAKDGLDGLDKLAAELPVVVLTDIEMPRMDGFDLVRNMRVDARLAGLPVIMITSRIAQKHHDYATELGVDHYLGKPYVEEELLGLVARYARRAVPVA